MVGQSLRSRDENEKYEFDPSKWFRWNYGAAKCSDGGSKGMYTVSIFWNLQNHGFRRHEKWYQN